MILRRQNPSHLTTLREIWIRHGARRARRCDAADQRRSRASASWASDATCVPVPVEDAGEREAPAVGDPSAAQLVEQPVVGAQRPVEPDRVVEAGGEHPLPVRAPPDGPTARCRAGTRRSSTRTRTPAASGRRRAARARASSRARTARGRRGASTSAPLEVQIRRLARRSDSGAGTPLGAETAAMSIDASGRWKLAMRFSTAPRAWYATTWRVANEPLSRTRSTS